MTEPIQVRLLNDPMRRGVFTSRERSRGERLLWQVMFPDGTQWVPKDQLEVMTGERESPLDLLKQGKLGGAADLRRALTHVRLTGKLADVIYSMEATNTDFYAYQFKPVLKVLQSPTSGILIADEVGLGKTIEAGLAWTELRSRFDMRRLLVLCPAALREKWRDELFHKMGVDAEIVDTRTTLRRLRDHERSHRGFALVGSTQGLRPGRDWESPTDRSAAAELARFLQSQESEERLVDLVVIDEAHHLRNPETQTHKLGRLFRNVAEYTILLTATPIHNKNQDLHALLRLLDPDTFHREDDFTAIIEANEPLVSARDKVLAGSLTAEGLMALLKRANDQPLLNGNRQLRTLMETNPSTPELAKPDVRSRIAYRLESANLLGHVVTRTRKRDVKEWRVVREPRPEFVEMSPTEEDVYRRVTDLVVRYAATRDANEQFLLVMPQRQISSSMPAALQAWKERQELLVESDETGTTEDARAKERLGPLTAEIVRQCHELCDLPTLEASDSKYRTLVQILTGYFEKHPRDKVVLFSYFRPTLSYLARRLKADGITNIVLRGGDRRSKDDVIREFREPDGPQVLLSSEVGGEGVDLQFSWVVINYDLPWNPMRVEQRIGRVDRLGQESDRVVIWNLLYQNTIDARIYKRLYEKLDLCRRALGDFEAILGEQIQKLTLDLLFRDLTEDEQNRRIDQTATALENTRHEEEKLEEDAAHLTAYGDYILNRIHSARDMNRWITGEDIRSYVSDYLGVHYPGSQLRQVDHDKPVFELSLSTQAKHELGEFIRHERLSIPTRLTQSSGIPINCIFENRVTGPTQSHAEVISQFHPLLRFVSHQLKQKAAQLTPCVAIALAEDAWSDSAISAGTYLVAMARWSVKALQATEKLVYAAAPLASNAELLDGETAEKIALAAASHGSSWLEARETVDLEAAFVLANNVLFGHLDDRYDEFVEEIRAQNEDRADIQERTLDNHIRAQQDVLGQVQSDHVKKGRHSLAKATEARLKKLEARVAQRRLAIQSGRRLAANKDEIGVAIIRIA